MGGRLVAIMDTTDDKVRSQLHLNKSEIGERIVSIRSSSSRWHVREKGEDSRMSSDDELHHIGVQTFNVQG